MSMHHNTNDDRSLREDFTWELQQLRQESLPDEQTLAAVTRRLRLHVDQPYAPPVAWWRQPALLAGAPVALAAAAALLLWVGRTPSPTDLPLDSAEWTAATVSRDVQLQFEGSGHARAVDREHRIDWIQGTLEVSVTPDQGIDLQVETPEATVAVVGTVFTVTRYGVSTRVSVERGKVSVTCEGSQPTVITADDGEKICYSDDPIAFANRSKDRLQTGDFDDVVDLSTRGLPLAEPGSYADAAMRTYRAEARLYRNDADLASIKADAEAALAADQSFALRARRALVLVGIRSGDVCETLPHLRALSESGDARPNEMALLADCIQDDRPEEARALWARAKAETDDEKLRADIDRWLEALKE